MLLTNWYFPYDFFTTTKNKIINLSVIQAIGPRDQQEWTNALTAGIAEALETGNAVRMGV